MNTTSSFTGAPNWESKCAMRTYEFPAHQIDDEPGHYFAPHLISSMAYLTEDERARIRSSDLEKQALLRYLANTESIEIDLVNPSLLFIMEGNFEQSIHLEAYRIYADEGFHAAMCVSLRESIGRTAVGHPNSCRYRSQPLAMLLQQIRSDCTRTQQLRVFFASAINETLITQSLLQAKDPSLKPSIRTLISTHAMDEAQHHKFFAHLFAVVWEQMSQNERQDVASLLPVMLKLLLAPDEQAIEEDLIGVGVDADRAEAIARLVGSETPLLERIQHGARGSLHAMSRSGMFACEFVRNAFGQHQLDQLIGDRIK